MSLYPIRHIQPPVPKRLGYALPYAPWSEPLRLGYLNQVDLVEHYAKSQKDMRRIPVSYLRALADTLPGQAAIKRITDGVIAMPWSVAPPKDLRNDVDSLTQAKRIERSLHSPNPDEFDTYTLFASAIIADLLVTNIAAVERVPGDLESTDEDLQPFWLWPVDPLRIEKNLEWNPQQAGVIPRYYDTGYSQDPRQWKALLDRDLFLLRLNANSWRSNPPSPMEVAFRIITAWLGLTDYQTTTTSKASAEWLIDLGEVTEPELQAFRIFFKNEVLGKGETPIVGSRGPSGVKVVKIGASNDDGLYLKYAEYLLRLIALAFALSARDLNIQEHDNRATAGVAADSTFQFAILPIAKILIERFDKDAVRFYYPGYELSFSDTEPRNQKEEAETSNILYTANLLTQNEARQSAGWPSLGPAGDVFANGQALKSEEEAAADAKAQELIPPAPNEPETKTDSDADKTPPEKTKDVKLTVKASKRTRSPNSAPPDEPVLQLSIPLAGISID